jgi:CheY-like chemotaxis protein
VVEDTGKGIAQEILDRVFDPYFTTKKMGEGTGLGLSIVHGIVKRHQGHIEIDSLPEKGTKILVSFPQCSLPEESFTFGDVEHSYRGNGESILFVDDELQIVDLQYEMLQELGYQVKAVSDSKQALQCFEESPDEFDLLITDMMMPKMTGAELARAVLEIRPGLPVIVCTGFSDQISAEKARQLGIQGFLLKPVINQDLAKKIYEILHPE